MQWHGRSDNDRRAQQLFIMENITGNTSGHGPAATVPAEIDRWNWGAFLLNWIWGIGNHTYIALLMFVPIANIVMPFVLGAKGNAWAWRNKRWENIEHFKSVQRKWAIWGLIAWIVGLLMFVALVFFVASGLKNAGAYTLAVETLQANERAVEELGSPISAGYPMGSIQVSGPSGSANLAFSVEGPKGSGTVYVDAVKDFGQWTLNRIELEMDQTGRRINLMPAPSVLLDFVPPMHQPAA